MSVREFELFHGCVITKLLRSEKPVTLRLIETKPVENWSTYTLNDSVDLFVCYSKSPRTVSSKGGGTSWTFVFSHNQLKKMNPPSRERPLYLALVCGRSNLKDEDMQVCLLRPEQITDLIDFAAVSQSLTIRRPRTKGKLRVYKDRKERFLVAQSCLEKWEIPNS